MGHQGELQASGALLLLINHNENGILENSFVGAQPSRPPLFHVFMLAFKRGEK